jgi:hypothetical protein
VRFIGLAAFACAAMAQERIVIQTSAIPDGEGGVLKNQQIVVEGGRIQSVGAGSGKADYELRGLTVMPGWIDTHTHLNWDMDANHRSISGGGKLEDAALYTEADAWMTLQGRLHYGAERGRGVARKKHLTMSRALVAPAQPGAGCAGAAGRDRVAAKSVTMGESPQPNC